MYGFARDLDAGIPCLPILLPIHAHDSTFVILGDCAISGVLLLRHIAQVFYSIISFYSVYMVDIGRPLTIDQNPYHPVRSICFPENAPNPITMGIYCCKRLSARHFGVPVILFMLR